MFNSIPVQAEANLTVILPGGCNAACNFCFWEPKAVSPQWLSLFEGALKNIQKAGLLTQVSVSGGEPTVSPYFLSCLDTLREYKERIPLKVVLNTNGSNLLAQLPFLQGAVDHINISRHATSDEENFSTFGSFAVPSTTILSAICAGAESFGIDVTLNKVVPQEFDNPQDLWDMVDLGKKVGAVGLVLRKDVRGSDLSPLPVETSLGRMLTESSCPVCVSRTYRVKGFPVQCKAGYSEPSSLPLEYAHELILQPSGELTLDWKGEKALPSVPSLEKVFVSDGKIRNGAPKGGTSDEVDLSFLSNVVLPALKSARKEKANNAHQESAYYSSSCGYGCGRPPREVHGGCGGSCG